MALRQATRTDGAEPTVYSDELVRCVLKTTPDGVEVWGEWKVQVRAGRFKTVSIRCSPMVEAEILALPNLPTALDMAAADTHARAVEG